MKKIVFIISAILLIVAVFFLFLTFGTNDVKNNYKDLNLTNEEPKEGGGGGGEGENEKGGREKE